MMAIVYLGLTVLALWGARRLGMPPVNGISAFMVPWSAVLGLASIPGVMKPGLTALTWTMVWVTTVSLVVGVVVGWLFAKRRGTVSSVSKPADIDVSGLARWHWIFVIALICYTLLQIAKLLPVFAEQGGWEAILTGNGSTLKLALIEAAAQSASVTFSATGLFVAVLGYVLFLGNLSLFSGALLLRPGRRLVAALPLVVSAFYSVVTLQRTTFVMAFLIMGTSWVVVHTAEKHELSWRRIRELRHMPKKVVAGAVVMTSAGLVALLYPLVVRNQGTSNPVGFTSLANYAVSGVAGLNAHNVGGTHWNAPVVDGVVGPLPGLGSYTFSGIFNILARLGIAVPQSPINLDFYDVVLFGTKTTTNTNTSLGEYFLDFGWAGLVILPLVLALAVGYFQRRYVDTRRVVFLPPVVFLLVSSIWSFFVASLLGDFRLIVVCSAGAVLLHWVITRSVGPQRSGLGSREVQSLEDPS